MRRSIPSPQCLTGERSCYGVDRLAYFYRGARPTSISELTHAVLDTIMTRLEARYGADPRVERGFRLFMADKVELSAEDSSAALVHGDSGKCYWTTVSGFCECP